MKFGKSTISTGPSIPVRKVFLSLPGWVSPSWNTFHLGMVTMVPIVRLVICRVALTRSHQVVFFLYFSAKDGSMTNSASTWEITWELFGYVWRLILIQDIKISKHHPSHKTSTPNLQNLQTGDSPMVFLHRNPWIHDEQKSVPMGNPAADCGKDRKLQQCDKICGSEKGNHTLAVQKHLNHWKRLFSSEHGVASGQHRKSYKLWQNPPFWSSVNQGTRHVPWKKVRKLLVIPRGYHPQNG